MTIESDDEAELRHPGSPDAFACSHCGCSCQHRVTAQPRSARGSSPSSASARGLPSSLAPSRPSSSRHSSPVRQSSRARPSPPSVKASRYAAPVYPPPVPGVNYDPPPSNAKYYCVVVGYRTGVFHTWIAAQSVIRGLAKDVAVFQGFGGRNAYSEAISAYDDAAARRQVKEIPS
jgi:hypothetical protein